MNVARLNMSHGTQEYHRGTIERVRQVSANLHQPIAILADLQGPKLRVGKMQEGGVTLNKGDKLVLTVDEITGEPDAYRFNIKTCLGVCGLVSAF